MRNRLRPRGRAVPYRVWNDLRVHADDQVGEGVPAELAAFLRGDVDGRPVRITASVCGDCGGRVFSVLVNDCAAERECTGCGSRGFIADSEECWNEESWEDDEPGAAGCPCGGEEFGAAVAFTLGGDLSVRRVTLGLRCVADGFSAVYADWKIDYSPTDHLLTMVQAPPREPPPPEGQGLTGCGGPRRHSLWSTCAIVRRAARRAGRYAPRTAMATPVRARAVRAVGCQTSVMYGGRVRSTASAMRGTTCR